MEMLDSDMFDVIPLKLNMNKLYPIDLQTMVWFSNIDLTVLVASNSQIINQSQCISIETQQPMYWNIQHIKSKVNPQKGGLLCSRYINSSIILQLYIVK